MQLQSAVQLLSVNLTRAPLESKSEPKASKMPRRNLGGKNADLYGNSLFTVFRKDSPSTEITIVPMLFAPQNDQKIDEHPDHEKTT